MGVLKKDIIFFGKECCIVCDGKCNKAWGRNGRSIINIDGVEYWASDDELGVAPIDPGTYEGSDAKPLITTSSDMNRWCARECERCVILERSDDITESQLPSYVVRIEF